MEGSSLHTSLSLWASMTERRRIYILTWGEYERWSEKEWGLNRVDDLSGHVLKDPQAHWLCHGTGCNSGGGVNSERAWLPSRQNSRNATSFLKEVSFMRSTWSYSQLPVAHQNSMMMLSGFLSQGRKCVGSTTTTTITRIPYNSLGLLLPSLHIPTSSQHTVPMYQCCRYICYIFDFGPALAYSSHSSQMSFHTHTSGTSTLNGGHGKKL